MARTIALKQGTKPFLWRLHLALGRLYLLQRCQEEAEDAFSTMDALLEELAASNIPDGPLQENFLSQARGLIPPMRPLSSRRAAKRAFSGLTEREHQVAVLIAQGKSSREIAEALVVSERTIETHVGNILSKLDFTSRMQIAAWVAERGWTKSSGA